MSFPGFKAVSMVAAFGIALSPLQALAVTSTASPIATITATPTATATRTATATPTSSPSVTSTPTATATATPTATSTPEVLFSDVTQDHWAYNAIQSVVQKKIMNGYGDSSFRPDQPITRAETTKVVTLAATRKILEKPAKVSLPFPDVSPQDGLIPYIQHAYDNKIIKGYADKTFRPSKPVTRGEFLKIFTLSTNSVFKDYDTGEAFLDVSADNDLASYIYSARALGYIKGSSTGLFYPNIPITRAEAAQIIYLYLNDKDATFAQATDLENKMLQQINAKRAAEGKGALILDDRLGSLAKKQSQELFDQWHFLSKEQKKAYESSHASQTDQDKQRPWTSHRNASGLTFDQWFSLASKKFNINYNEATQNIAHAFYDSATPADRVNDIINKMFEKGSDGTYLYAHAYNLLGSYVSYTHIGLGIVVGDEPEEMYVTQILTR